MKINSINTGHYRKRGNINSSYALSGHAYERESIKQNNKNQISTTIMSNSDGRASFKGGTPFLHSVGKFVTYSPLIAEAIFALFITCGARPLTIMATAKTDEDKEKCLYQASKSISSGVVGLAMTALVGTPIGIAVKQAKQNKAFTIPPEIKERAQESVNKGIEVLGNFSKKLIEEGKDTQLAEQINELIHGGKLNLKIISAGKKSEKIFKQTIEEKAPEISKQVKEAIAEQRVLNNYSATAKNVMDKLFQPAFMPLRATITVALVPVILSMVGIKKSNNKKQAKEENPFEHVKFSVFQTGKEERIFNSFSGVAKHENK